MTYAVKAGRISPLPDGTIDPVEADKAWLANTATRGATAQTAAARRRSAKPPTAQADYHEERAKHEKAKRERAELELAVRKGKLLEVASVRAGVFEAFRTLRDKLRAVPARVGQEVAVESDVALCVAIIGREVDAALGEVAAQADKIAPVKG